MGSVIIFLTMGLAAGRSGIANRMRSLLPKINRISGVLLVLAGIYLVNYGWFQRDPLNNSNFLIEEVESWQTWVVNWINDRGAKDSGLVMLSVSGVIVLAALAWRMIGTGRGGGRSGDTDAAVEPSDDDDRGAVASSSDVAESAGDVEEPAPIHSAASMNTADR